MGNNKKKPVQLELTLDRFSQTGNGVGFVSIPNGKERQVEVSFGLPGDTVRATIFLRRSGYAKAHIDEILTPSSLRIAPKCVHFGVCGGCRFQQISYEEQLKYKEQFVRECFASLINDSVVIHPIISSSEPWHYRNKMEFTFSQDSKGNRFLGLIMDSSKGKVFHLTECHLVHQWFVNAVHAVRSWWHESKLDAYHPLSDKGSLRLLTLREGTRTGDRMVVLTVSGNPDFALQKSHLETFVAFLREVIEPKTPAGHLSVFLRIQQTARGMPTNFYEMLLHGPDYIREILHIQPSPKETPASLLFHISPTAFFQPNTQQAEKIYARVLQLAEVSPDTVVYDLYCGTGTMGLCISKYVKQVVGIELWPESALDAQNNIKRNNCNNMVVFTGAVRHMLAQIRTEGTYPPPDLVVVDPPRSGIDPEALRQLMALSPPKIIYVCCNPITQASNIAALITDGYRLVALQPVDQYPQTYHVENIALLVKA